METVTGREFRMAVVNVLMEHQFALEDRREKRTATSWPDESDIYDMTIMRLRTLFDQEREDAD